MPLAFKSINHGTVAFGFFNIESDMLLLEHYFFFARDFCAWISELAEIQDASKHETRWPVFDIPLRENIGDLMGAIHGFHFSGFIGELYKRYPFPANQEHFKQNPEGYKTRQAVETLIKGYSVQKDIPVILNVKRGEAAVGEYRFNRKVFQDLLLYVWQGGYPRWKGDMRPEYVRKMKETLEANPHGLFEGISFP
ncbi:MAG: hypothetical protein DRG82_01080 [Deltaproteobacteria bacterium]|nr:MAG: hypothetical protein DRG82_01080 [Deltaproteobacteria bacterium]